MGVDDGLSGVIDQTRVEISPRQRYPRDYAYVAFILALAR